MQAVTDVTKRPVSLFRVVPGFISFDDSMLATLEGWLYLAVILDLFSRRVVGWKLGESLESELVVTALKNALVLRQPDEGLYFHSDRGSQNPRFSTDLNTSSLCFGLGDTSPACAKALELRRA